MVTDHIAFVGPRIVARLIMRHVVLFSMEAMTFQTVGGEPK